MMVGRRLDAFIAAEPHDADALRTCLQTGRLPPLPVPSIADG